MKIRRGESLKSVAIETPPAIETPLEITPNWKQFRFQLLVGNPLQILFTRVSLNICRITLWSLSTIMRGIRKS